MSRTAFDLGMVAVTMIVTAISVERPKLREPAQPIIQPAQAAEIEPPPAQRQDSFYTFSRRWEGESVPPPVTKVRDRLVSVERDTLAAPHASAREVANAVTSVATVAPDMKPRRHRFKSARPVRRDVCARHGLKRVVVGRGWRCRK